jgi:hypothetical protein
MTSALTERYMGTQREHVVDSLEIQIRKAEQRLGIETQAQRLLEASLVIDKPFFEAALLTDYPQPERLFGDKEWLAYLNARLLAKKHGKKPLTSFFIQDIHAELMKTTYPGVSTTITDSVDPRGGAVIANTVIATSLTDKQVRTIKNNPYLHWQAKYDSFLHSGYVGYSVKTRKERLAELDKICNWYNAERRNGDLSPHALAARLQHKLVSLHALPYDYNGRVSRILMNWSLENDGLPPSALHDFDADIFTHEVDWAQDVKAGCERYLRFHNRILLATDEDMATLFGLGAEKAFYQTHQDYSNGNHSPKLRQGNWLEKAPMQSFLSNLERRIRGIP